MALYNHAADAANTAVRAFLTKIGEYYLQRSFNTSNGQGKIDWEKIKYDIFNGKCAYCGKEGLILQMDHLIMFNKEQMGLHHPGNIVPACVKCNKRSKNKNNIFNNWEDHLSFICKSNKEENLFLTRWEKIKIHLGEGQYAYPILNEEEYKTLKIITNNLYERVKDEFDKSLKLFEELDKSFNLK